MGRSQGNRLRIKGVSKGSSETRGKKEFKKISQEAKKTGLTRQSSLSELLASSYADSLNCEIDQKIINQINSELSQETSLETTESLEKMLEIFQEQALTKQQFQSLQMKMKARLIKTIKEKTQSGNLSEEEISRLDKIKANVDEEVHKELLRTNSQYRRFF